MRLLELHVCPLWEDGEIGMYERPDHPPVIGWCNVGVFEMAGERREFLLVHYEEESDG
jgi:hypothetical protein